MRALIFFTLSLLFLFISKYYVNTQLTQKGEYKASLYIINEYTTRVDITSNIDESHFVSHSYISSPGIESTAVFVSKGVFIDDSIDSYTIRYNIKQLKHPRIISTEKAGLYINMVGRLGHVIEEDIKMIYHSDNISIFDMNRNNNIITYMRIH